jgi:drug/metabolite transporter (DMT)-like permease
MIGTTSLLGVGLLFGMSGVAAKYLSHYLNAYQVVAYRFGFALIGAVVLAVILRRRPSFAGIPVTRLVGFALLFPLSVILFVLAIFHGSVAQVVFSFYAGTLASSFALGRIFFHERVGLYKAVALVLVVVALVVLVDPLHHVTLSGGVVLGLASGLFQGGAGVFQKHLAVAPDRLSLLTLQTGAGLVLSLGVLGITAQPVSAHLSVHVWLVTAGYGLAMLAITYLFLVGFAHANLNTGSILVSSELFFGPFFAWLLLAESLPAHVLLAGGCVVVAAVLSNLPERGAP